MNPFILPSESTQILPLVDMNPAHFFDKNLKSQQHFAMNHATVNDKNILPTVGSSKVGAELGPRYVPGPTDIICARGKHAYNHLGNRWFRSLVAKKVDAYKNSKSRMEKTVLVSTIMETVRNAQPQGAFIRKHSGIWFEVTEAIAREKVGQGFRDQMQKDKQGSNTPPRYADLAKDVALHQSQSLHQPGDSTKSAGYVKDVNHHFHQQESIEPYSFEETFSDKTHPPPPPLEFAQSIERRLSLPGNYRNESLGLQDSALSPRPIFEGPQVTQAVSDTSSMIPRQRSAPSALLAFGGIAALPRTTWQNVPRGSSSSGPSASYPQLQREVSSLFPPSMKVPRLDEPSRQIAYQESRNNIGFHGTAQQSNAFVSSGEATVTAIDALLSFQGPTPQEASADAKPSAEELNFGEASHSHNWDNVDDDEDNSLHGFLSEESF